MRSSARVVRPRGRELGFGLLETNEWEGGSSGPVLLICSRQTDGKGAGQEICSRRTRMELEAERNEGMLGRGESHE